MLRLILRIRVNYLFLNEINITTVGTIESYARGDCVRGNHCPVIDEPRIL